MAINKNHEFEELDGVKCGIVEKNVSAARASFLKSLLEYNRYTVVIVASPPPKAAAATVKVEEGSEEPPAAPAPVVPETFTVGVTDYTFNSINAIFGRLLIQSMPSLAGCCIHPINMLLHSLIGSSRKLFRKTKSHITNKA